MVLLLWIIYVISVLCVLCFRMLSVYWCLVVTCWEGLTSLLSFVMSYWVFATFPCGNLGKVWHLIVSIPYLCHLSYFFYCIAIMVVSVTSASRYQCRHSIYMLGMIPRNWPRQFRMYIKNNTVYVSWNSISTTTDQGYQWESDNVTNTHH